MKSLFKPDAQSEFIDAIAWYESQRPGLGKDFQSEVMAAIKIACANPERFRIVRGKARIIRLRRFHKYSIYFAIKGEVFGVISVFHASRNPDELKRRLK